MPVATPGTQHRRSDGSASWPVLYGRAPSALRSGRASENGADPEPNVDPTAGQSRSGCCASCGSRCPLTAGPAASVALARLVRRAAHRRRVLLWLAWAIGLLAVLAPRPLVAHRAARRSRPRSSWSRSSSASTASLRRSRSIGALVATCVAARARRRATTSRSRRPTASRTATSVRVPLRTHRRCSSDRCRSRVLVVAARSSRRRCCWPTSRS